MDVGKPSILNGFINQPNVQYVIPIYQRNYVWKKENINQLLSDIEKMINVTGNQNHFFGTIVFMETLSNGFFHEYTIIDGQQRLTTIFLILQALKQIYPECSSIIDESYLFNKSLPSADQNQRYRLKPLVTDDGMYQKISDNTLEKLSDEEKSSNIYLRFLQIKKKILEWKDNYDFGTILTAMDKLRIVRIKLDQDEEPQQVFESINSTGVNLTAADLIRNYILMNKDDETQTNIYNKYWSKIEFNYVKTENLKEFFRLYLSILKRETVSDREVYELFKKEYGEAIKTIDEEIILEKILKYAEIYSFVKFDDHLIKNKINNSKINSAMADFRNTESNMPALVIIETIRMYIDGEITQIEDVINTIKLMSNYILRRNLCGEDTKYISNAFGNFLGRILKYYKQSNNYYESVLRAIVNDNIGVGAYMPNDSIVREQFKSSNLYNRSMTAFMLRKIENGGSNIEMNNLNIEHVMPQTKTSYWETRINEGSTYEEVVNRIGNLTLVASVDNSAMSNKNFENKKIRLNETKHVKLNEYILNQSNWDENIISERSDIIADEFIKLFPYPDLPADLPLILNVNEDDKDLMKKIKNYTPVEVMFGNEDTYSVSLRDDAFKRILKCLYHYDKDSFLYSYTVGKGLTSSVEFGGTEIEVPIDTLTSFNNLQSIIKKMNIDIPIRIRYTKEKTISKDDGKNLFA